MKKLIKMMLLVCCLCNVPVKSQTTCNDYLNDFIPKPTDSVLQINVRFIIFTKPGGGGVWDGNNTGRADSLLDRINRIHADIPAPKLPISGVAHIQHSKIKFVRKSYNTYADSLGYFGYDPQHLTQFIDTNALNLIYNYGAFTGVDRVPYLRMSLGASVPSDIASSTRERTVIHELGHMLGLDHSTSLTAIYSPTDTVGGDGPTHIYPINGCCSMLTATDYVLEDSIIGHDCSDSRGSNNMMTQNSHCHQYLSPQQMAVIHYYLRTRLRRVLTPYSYFNHLNINTAENYTVDNTDQNWTNDRYIKGNITIKSGFTLFVNCQLAMNGRGRIIVEKNARLIVTGDGHITNISGHTWMGVQVSGDHNNSNQTLLPSGYSPYHGQAAIINGGTLSHAHNAISNYTLYPSFNDTCLNIQCANYFSSGGIIIGNQGNFLNNERDIEFIGYPNASASSFTSCNFKTTGPITDTIGAFPRPETPSYIHVSMWATNSIKFQNCTFEYAAGNTYTTLGVGILSIDAKYSVEGLCPPTSGFCNNPGIFKNLDRGIVVQNANNLAVINVSHCIFDNIKTDGINIYNMKAPVIQTCYFKVPAGSGSSGDCGIYLHYTKNYNVRNNTFEEIGAGKTNMAIQVNKSEIGSHEVYRNNFAGFAVAINSINNNSGYGNIYNGLKMNCNDFTPEENSFDISVHGNGTGYNAPSVMRKQGNPFATLPVDLVRNKYGSTNCGNWGKWYMAGAGTNTLTIIHGCNSNSLSAGVTDPTGCSVSELSVTALPVNFNYAAHCASGQTSSGGSSYITKFEQIQNINDYLGELLLQGASADKFELQATATAKLNYYLSDSLPESMDSVIKIFSDNPGEMEDADIELIFAYLAKGDYSAATAQTDLLPASRYDWQTLFYKLIAIYQEPEGIFCLDEHTPSHLEYLNFMTELASAEGKDGCEIARALLKVTRNVDYETLRPYPEISGERQSSALSTTSIRQIAEGENIQVYPNPANNVITIYYNSKMPNGADLEIRDLLGKTLYTGTINNAEPVELSLKNYSNGVYIVTLSKNRELLYKTKLIKQD